MHRAAAACGTATRGRSAESTKCTQWIQNKCEQHERYLLVAEQLSEYSARTLAVDDPCSAAKVQQYLHFELGVILGQVVLDSANQPLLSLTRTQVQRGHGYPLPRLGSPPAKFLGQQLEFFFALFCPYLSSSQ